MTATAGGDGQIRMPTSAMPLASSLLEAPSLEHRHTALKRFGRIACEEA
jgi:hypothetical protein